MYLLNMPNALLWGVMADAGFRALHGWLVILIVVTGLAVGHPGAVIAVPLMMAIKMVFYQIDGLQ